MKLRFLLCRVLLAFFVFCQAANSQTFTSNQNADGLIGQPDFTSLGFSNLANRLNSPRASAFDPINAKIYVCDGGNHRILRYSVAAFTQPGAFPECVFGQENFTNNLSNQGAATPSAKTLNSPRHLIVDTLGTLWVSDSNNNRVLRFDNAAFLGINSPASAVLGQSNFTTGFSGTTATTLNGPYGLSMDSAGGLWVADRSNNRVLRFANAIAKANGAAANLVLGQADFTSNSPAVSASAMAGPFDAKMDSGGRLWVSDALNNRILRFDAAASITTHGAAANGVLGQATFVDGLANGGGTPSANRLNIPLGLHPDSKGDLWVVDFDNKRVLRFGNPSGLTDGSAANLVLGQADFSSTVSSTAANGFVGPISVSAGPGGSLLVTDFDSHRVVRHSPVNRAPTINLSGANRITTSSSSVTIRGQATDSDGTLSKIKATVNGKLVTVTGKSPWSFKASLKIGTNLVKINAFDNLGLTSRILSVTVTRR